MATQAKEQPKPKIVRVQSKEDNLTIERAVSDANATGSRKQKRKKKSPRTIQNIRRGSKSTMATLALKFPKIRRSFEFVRNQFHAHNDKKSENENAKYVWTKVTSVKGLAELLPKLIPDESTFTFTDEKVQELFTMVDLDKSQTIDFKELLVAIGVGYYLKEDSKGKSDEFIEVQNGFRSIQEAFDSMDVDKSGTIDVTELKAALFSSNEQGLRKGKRGKADNVDAKFNELDFDKGGDIDFAEFMYGLTAWVGMDEDDDDTAGASHKKSQAEAPSASSEQGGAKGCCIIA